MPHKILLLFWSPYRVSKLHKSSTYPWTSSLKSRPKVKRYSLSRTISCLKVLSITSNQPSMWEEKARKKQLIVLKRWSKIQKPPQVFVRRNRAIRKFLVLSIATMHPLEMSIMNTWTMQKTTTRRSKRLLNKKKQSQSLSSQKAAAPNLESCTARPLNRRRSLCLGCRLKRWRFPLKTRTAKFVGVSMHSLMTAKEEL